MFAILSYFGDAQCFNFFLSKSNFEMYYDTICYYQNGFAELKQYIKVKI